MSLFICAPIRLAGTLLVSALLASGCSSSGEAQSSVGGGTVDTVQASLELVADKTVHISWQSSADVQFYRVLENPDGVSGYTQISADLDASTQQFDHRIALYSSVNARYIVQACNTSGCVDSDEQMVSGSLKSAIGYFKASNTDSSDWFGQSISISADGQTMVVGAPNEGSLSAGINGNQNDDSIEDAGAAYVFVRSNGAWQQQAYLKASNPHINSWFGLAVSLSADGNTLAVAAPYEDSGATGINGNQADSSADRSGAVYVFVHNNGTWQQQAYVKASNTDTDDFFGGAVSLNDNGDTLAVGSVNTTYVFTRSSDTWQQQALMTSGNTESEGDFGRAISLSADGNTLAVGAPKDSSVSLNSGAVSVFARNNGVWQQQAYLKPSNTNFLGEFGYSVSLSADGSTLAVGAYNEQSAATGIDGDQNDDSVLGAGAVYVFVSSNGGWQQQAYLKASNTRALGYFGGAVSLSSDGHTLAVGAHGESGAATGIDGDQNNAVADSSGAVYVFTRTNDIWQQQAYVKASNTESWNEFGLALSLSADGNTLAVGARGEQSAATGVNGYQDDHSAQSSGAVYLY